MDELERMEDLIEDLNRAENDWNIIKKHFSELRINLRLFCNAHCTAVEFSDKYSNSQQIEMIALDRRFTISIAAQLTDGTTSGEVTIFQFDGDEKERLLNVVLQRNGVIYDADGTKLCNVKSWDPADNFVFMEPIRAALATPVHPLP